jgi:hypothetical protein
LLVSSVGVVTASSVPCEPVEFLRICGNFVCENSNKSVHASRNRYGTLHRFGELFRLAAGTVHDSWAVEKESRWPWGADLCLELPSSEMPSFAQSTTTVRGAEK